VPQSFIDEQTAEDPLRASAEYGALFRADLETFVPREVIDACIEPGIFERPPLPEHGYFAFCDPSEGASDSMTLAIAHIDHNQQVTVVDLIRERPPPFSPEQVVEEFVTAMKRYWVYSVRGDKVGGAWVREEFSRLGVNYLSDDVPVKQQLYINLLAALNSRRVSLLDHRKLVTQLIGLERHNARGGKIDHGYGQHDDIANCVAGAVTYGFLQGERTADGAMVPKPMSIQESRAHDAPRRISTRRSRGFASPRSRRGIYWRRSNAKSAKEILGLDEDAPEDHLGAATNGVHV
jgi:hypothetical protein